jgi:hypothetical protein
MRDMSIIIIAFLAIILMACAPKEKDCEKDTDGGVAADVQTLEDTTQKVSKDCQDLCAKKGIDGDTCKAYCASERKKGVCYAACKGSAGYCKKVCYNKSDTKDAGSSLPEDVTSTNLPEDATSTK